MTITTMGPVLELAIYMVQKIGGTHFCPLGWLEQAKLYSRNEISYAIDVSVYHKDNANPVKRH